MRLNSGRIAPINKLGRSNQQGIVTLEAAITMPAFLLLAVFMIFLVQTAITSMALQGALTNTVRLAASAWYPIHQAQGGEGAPDVAQSPFPGTEAGDQEKKLKDVRETIEEYGKWLPAPLNEWAEWAGDWKQKLKEEAAKKLFSSLVLSLADTKVLEAERFELVSVQLPDQENENLLALEGQYRLPFRVPFTGKPLVIRAKAAERVWTGGLPSSATLPEENGNPLGVQFVSLSPDPVRPGRKATLVLQAEPGAVLDLSVIYKSGESKAKNLGRAVADDAGHVSWTWHVSGNTTSGQWTWLVSGEEGIYEQAFQVERYHEQEGGS